MICFNTQILFHHWCMFCHLSTSKSRIYCSNYSSSVRLLAIVRTDLQVNREAYFCPSRFSASQKETVKKIVTREYPLVTPINLFACDCDYACDRDHVV